MNRDLPDVKAGFRKGRGTRDQIANISWIIEKAREFQKTHSSPDLWMDSFLLCHHCAAFFKYIYYCFILTCFLQCTKAGLPEVLHTSQIAAPARGSLLASHN